MLIQNQRQNVNLRKNISINKGGNADAENNMF